MKPKDGTYDIVRWERIQGRLTPWTIGESYGPLGEGILYRICADSSGICMAEPE